MSGLLFPEIGGADVRASRFDAWLLERGRLELTYRGKCGGQAPLGSRIIDCQRRGVDYRAMWALWLEWKAGELPPAPRSTVGEP